MSTWINADIDFGVPWQTFTLNLRSVPGRRFYQEFVGSSQDDPEVLAAAVARVVAEERPELAGLSVISVSLDPLRGRWTFTIVHPNLPRIKLGHVSAAVRLERCIGCREPLPDQGEWRSLDASGDEASYCSESCSKREPAEDAVAADASCTVDEPREPRRAVGGWTPDDPNPSDPTKCKCGTSSSDPHCHCGC